MMAPSKHLTSRASAQTQVWLTAVVLTRKRGEQSVFITLRLASPLRLFFLFTEDLVAHNVDAVLNRRNCMMVTLRIIEENIPEVKQSGINRVG